MKGINIIKSFLKNNTLRLQLVKSNKIIGEARASFQMLSPISKISHLEIDKEYRKQGYGSYLLKNLENVLTNELDSNTFEIRSWQKQSDYLNDFYKKQGYTSYHFKSICEPKFIDDGEDIYDLYKFKKTCN